MNEKKYYHQKDDDMKVFKAYNKRIKQNNIKIMNKNKSRNNFKRVQRKIKSFDDVEIQMIRMKKRFNDKIKKLKENIIEEIKKSAKGDLNLIGKELKKTKNEIDNLTTNYEKFSLRNEEDKAKIHETLYKIKTINLY